MLCVLFKDTMNHFGTYLRTYLLTYVLMCVQVLVIFEGSHPTLKLIKQEMSEIIQVNVPNFFFILPKSKKVRAKKTILGPKNQS